MAPDFGLMKAIAEFAGWIIAGLGTAFLWLARTLVFTRLDKLESRLGALESIANKGVTHIELSAAVSGLKNEINEVNHKIETSRAEIKEDVKEVKGDVKEVRNDIKEVMNLLVMQANGGRNNGNRKT